MLPSSPLRGVCLRVDGLAVIFLLVTFISAFPIRVDADDKKPATTAKSSETARLRAVREKALRDLEAAQDQYRLSLGSGDLAANAKKAVAAAKMMKAAGDAAAIGLDITGDGLKKTKNPELVILGDRLKALKQLYDMVSVGSSAASASNRTQLAAAGVKALGVVTNLGSDALSSGLKAASSGLDAQNRLDRGDDLGAGLSAGKSLIQSVRSMLNEKELTKKYENAAALMTAANDLIRAYHAYGAAEQEGAEVPRVEADLERRFAEWNARLREPPRDDATAGRATKSTSSHIAAVSTRQATQVGAAPRVVPDASPIEFFDNWHDLGDRAFDNMPAMKDRFYQVYPQLKQRYGDVAAYASPASDVDKDVANGTLNMSKVKNEAIVANETLPRATASRPASGGPLDYIDPIIGQRALDELRSSTSTSTSMGSISFGDMSVKTSADGLTATPRAQGDLNPYAANRRFEKTYSVTDASGKLVGDGFTDVQLLGNARFLARRSAFGNDGYKIYDSTTGKPVSPTEYAYVQPLGNGYFGVPTKSAGLLMNDVVDANGNVVARGAYPANAYAPSATSDRLTFTVNGNTGGIDLRRKQQYEAEPGLAAENEDLWRQIQARKQKAGISPNPDSTNDHRAGAVSSCRLERAFAEVGQQELANAERQQQTIESASGRREVEGLIQVQRFLLDGERANLYTCLARNPAK
jgi:hypothetical protein